MYCDSLLWFVAPVGVLYVSGGISLEMPQFNRKVAHPQHSFCNLALAAPCIEFERRSVCTHNPCTTLANTATQANTIADNKLLAGGDQR
jgi:hypothetical protein